MKKFVKIYHLLIRSLSAGQKFISLLLDYKVLSVQLGIVLVLLLINANYYACLNIKAITTSTLEEVITPSYLDINSSTGSVQFNSPIKQVNTTPEIQVSAALQLQQPNISPLIQVITVPSLLRSGSDYEKTETDQSTSGKGWEFDETSGTLTLNGDLIEPDKHGQIQTMWPWEGLRSQVKTVEINGKIGIKTGSSMFAYMPQLSKITGLSNLDSLQYMNDMFAGDSSLTEKNFDASQLKLDDVIQCGYMFDGCTQLKNLDVSKWNVGNVQNFSYMFSHCTNLTSIKGLETWKVNEDAATNTNATASATDMSYMFASDENLSSLNLSNFDTSKVTTFQAMFSGCTKLKSITGISNWKNNKATDMYSMFAYDTALDTLDLSSFTTPAATNMSYMFASDENLSSLNLSNFDTSKVTNFQAMFSGCTNLASITGLDKWNNATATNMSYMFAYNDNLKNLNLSNFHTSKVTTFEGMFASDPTLTKLDLSSFDTSNVENFWKMFYGCTNLASIDGLNNWNTKAATNMSSMFAYDRSLTKLDLSSFDTSNVENFSSMFDSCDKLNSITLTSITGLNNKWETTSATNMSYMFAYDKSLTKLDLSNFDTSKVATFQAMFAGCENLASIDGLNNWDTKAATNMSSMFAYASSLQKLDLSSFYTTNATQNNFFLGDKSLWYLKIGKNTKLNDNCGLPEAPKNTEFPSEFPKKYKTSQNGKWQTVTNTVVDKTGAVCWWQPNDDIYTKDEIINYSQSNDNNELFIWQPAFNQSKGSLVLTVSPSQIRFNIILDTNNNILGNNNKSSYLAEANSDLEYTVQNPKGESWQLYAMMTKFKKSNSDSVINIGTMSLSLNEDSKEKSHPLNQQPTSIRTSTDNSPKWALKPMLKIGDLENIAKAGSSYATTIDYDLVNSIQ